MSKKQRSATFVGLFVALGLPFVITRLGLLFGAQGGVFLTSSQAVLLIVEEWAVALILLAIVFLWERQSLASIGIKKMSWREGSADVNPVRGKVEVLEEFRSWADEAQKRNGLRTGRRCAGRNFSATSTDSKSASTEQHGRATGSVSTSYNGCCFVRGETRPGRGGSPGC